MRQGRLVGLLLLLAAAPVARLTAQVSPGPLARPHQELEGTLKCTRCHAGGKEAMRARCVACHQDIGWLAERNRGLHGSAAARGERCATCHPDHAGADFHLVKWPDGSRERFDHRRAGWRLEQSHAALRCEECHEAANRKSPAAALAANRRSNWTGLETACVTCHEDVHRGALGGACTACHDAGKWKATPGFEHDTTDYPLTGRHAEVACDQCHLAARLSPRRDQGGHLIPVYQPVPHGSCASCHADPHGGQFGRDCTACHATTRPFTQVSGGAGFDHGRTRFPLRGLHATTRCAACHQSFQTEKDKHPGFGTCTACHADPHGGSATLAGRSVDCAACHGERGFSPGTLSIERHQETRFPLAGRHRTVRCAGCHVKDPSAAGTKWGSARVVIRPGFGTCAACHADPHGTQLAGRAGGVECGGCHVVEGWKPSRFDRAAHAKLRLPLDGRHAEVACRACHGADRKALPPLGGPSQLGPAGFAFKGLDPACGSCHVDPHRGRYEAKGQRPVRGGCLACHDTRAFSPAAVDVTAHQGFRFALTGAHRATPCAACHQELGRRVPAKAPTLVAAAGQPSMLVFEAPLTCAECHRSAHGTQFDGRRDGGRCDACHDTDGFAPASRFDHDRDAAFALQGGHRTVPCASCHRPDPKATAPGRLLYRPLSGKCESCHAGKKP